MLNAYTARLNVTGNLENFRKLNKTIDDRCRERLIANPGWAGAGVGPGGGVGGSIQFQSMMLECSIIHTVPGNYGTPAERTWTAQTSKLYPSL